MNDFAIIMVLKWKQDVKKMQNNFSGELKTSSLAKVNNMQIKIKSSTVQGTLIQITVAYLHVTGAAIHVLDL